MTSSVAFSIVKTAENEFAVDFTYNFDDGTEFDNSFTNVPAANVQNIVSEAMSQLEL
jgi:hypothetical protein